MNCPKCGVEVLADASFCHNCGSPLKTGSRALPRTTSSSIGGITEVFVKIEDGPRVNINDKTSRDNAWELVASQVLGVINEHERQGYVLIDSNIGFDMLVTQKLGLLPLEDFWWGVRWRLADENARSARVVGARLHFRKK